MPRKVREGVRDLYRAGFVLSRCKGSHRRFKNNSGSVSLTVSGHDGDDLHHYQEKEIRRAIEEVSNE
ncbi:MAG: type II toxin-antitoxin system HicA family toxin [Verrucomicrobiales bacterium]|nr:type II toxin-antitoxin system HicA family toxin [Verrucomicrobiales bacterium]